MISVLSDEGVSILDQIAAARALLAFDYDGTLAPYTDERDLAELRAETRTLLRTAALLYPCEEAARGERREFEMFRKHLRWFGYEFFLLQRS